MTHRPRLQEVPAPLPDTLVVVATFKRPATLQRLLDSLTTAGNTVAGVIVVDNANDAETRAVMAKSPVRAQYLCPGKNLGCGGGVNYGLTVALKNRAANHFWIFDDDALARPNALLQLHQALRKSNAELAAPIILNHHGNICWPPGLLEEKPRRAVKKNTAPTEYAAQCGLEPVPISWSPWPSILVTRKALETVGLPREDFWLMCEDLEFSLRITSRFKGIFVPGACCDHLPPPMTNPGSARQNSYLRFCAMLQNHAYCSLHLNHARRIMKHLPGNYLRFFRTFGIYPSVIGDASKAFWWGGFRGKAAGMAGFQDFHHRWLELLEEKPG